MTAEPDKPPRPDNPEEEQNAPMRADSPSLLTRFLRWLKSLFA